MDVKWKKRIHIIPEHYFLWDKLLHGISNSYLRMHGGKALREHTKYNWYKRCKKK